MVSFWAKPPESKSVKCSPFSPLTTIKWQHSPILCIKWFCPRGYLDKWKIIQHTCNALKPISKNHNLFREAQGMKYNNSGSHWLRKTWVIASHPITFFFFFFWALRLAELCRSAWKRRKTSRTKTYLEGILTASHNRTQPILECLAHTGIDTWPHTELSYAFLEPATSMFTNL